MFLIGNPRFERTKDIHGRELGTYYKNKWTNGWHDQRNFWV
jgi:hypothetical protein